MTAVTTIVAIIFTFVITHDDFISREHEINSHIGSGYDLWREDNVTRDGEGLYRFHSEDR